MPLATRIAEARTKMTAILSMLPSITDSQTWFYVAGAIGAVALAIGFLAAAASLIFGWRMNAEQKSATQVEIANVESAANERIEIETTNHLDISVTGIGILMRGSANPDPSKPPPPAAIILTPTLATLQAAFKTISMAVQFINMGPSRDETIVEVVVGSKPEP